ncbi:MAG: insulinase family protein, partial [Bacteroidales bacterium]|nr:insulinase family protein [Bacteroidales bacterium]
MKKILVISLGLLFGASLLAQNPLPADPEVRTGKLDNGLTYYIRHNENPAQRAEFYLATNAGAIQEAPDQDGLAHFLEHMCFNGLKNLPGKQMLEYLQKIGASFGANINASTGVESTQYMLNNIPVIREGIIDTCLLVMHDYSHFVLCEPEEIDAERGVILEERRTRRNASWRIYEKSMPFYYGDTKYAGCTVIGSEENLKTFKPESLVSFYETWYRPDNQAVIVIGDVDVDQIEQKLKALFSDIPAPVNPKAKDVIVIPDNAEPIVGIVTDPECSNSTLSVLWKHERMPEIYNNTDMAFVTDIAEDLISIVMSERFNDIAHAPDAPFFAASFGVGKLIETCEPAFGDINFKDGGAVRALTAFLLEIEKMRRFGFTDEEIQRAKDALLASYEKSAEAASTRKNSEFVYPLIYNFFDNEPIMDPKTANELAKQVCAMLNADMLGQMASALITDENLVVICTSPDKEGLVPTEAEILSVIKETREAEIEAPKGEEVAKELLNPAKLKGGKVKKTAEGLYGATEWTLKNGVKVVVLPTEYKNDQILIRLRMDGGSSLIEDSDLYSFENNIWTLWRNNCGIAGFSATQLSKMLAGKNFSMDNYISDTNHGISGNSTPKDFETALQCLYLCFTDSRFDADEYNLGIDQIRSMLPSLETNPMFQLQKRVLKTMNGDKPRCFAIDSDVLDKASIDNVERVFNKTLYKDAAGAVVYIVGKVDPAEIKPIVEKYIGSLPKGKKAKSFIMRDDDIVKGEVIDHFNVPMETAKTTVLHVYSADRPFPPEDTDMLNASTYTI